MEKYQTVDPTSEKLVESFAIADGTSIERHLSEAVQGFKLWRERSFSERAELLNRVADGLERHKSDLAALITLEMGKPLSQAIGEVEKCALGSRYFASQAPGLLQTENRSFDDRKASVRFDPLGPLFAIMPWNFPFWQLFRFAAPSLMAGNTIIMKHAPNTPQCALAIERLFTDAGAPVGVFSSLFLSNAQSADVVADSRIRGVTLTGSTRAGRAIGEAAGRAIKKVVLELGGSDPFIVLDDADIDRVASEASAARCFNNGQTCIAAKRFIVHASVYNRFRDAFVDKMKQRRLGDPRQPTTDNGPLARGDLREELSRQVGSAIAAGAKALCGGKPAPGPGYYYLPTVLDGLSPQLPIAAEELFGPVAMLFPYRGEAELLEIANGTPYGLGASIWTADPERGEKLAVNIDAGNVFINEIVKSSPQLPFGGVKDSGYGRELAAEGCREFTNVKAICRVAG